MYAFFVIPAVTMVAMFIAEFVSRTFRLSRQPSPNPQGTQESPMMSHTLATRIQSAAQPHEPIVIQDEAPKPASSDAASPSVETMPTSCFMWATPIRPSR